jgi:RsiW-degrading membrane proteinase PrsW (M82 family)
VARESRRRAVALLGVVLGFAALVGTLTAVPGDVDVGALLTGLLFDGWLLLWLGAVTVGLRSLGLLDVARAWLLGWFVAYVVAYTLGTGAGWVFGADTGVQRVVIVPVVEELAKLLPVLAVVTWLRRRHVWPTLSDVLLVGLAAGAAFGAREDVIRDRVAASGFGGVWGTLFPSTIHGEGVVVLTHPGWTAVAAVGVGLALLHRRPWAWLTGGALVALSVLDHAAQNARGDAGDRLVALLANGRIPAAALVLAILVAIVHDVVVLRATARADTVTTGVPLSRVARLAATAPRLAADAMTYRRLRVGGHLDSWRTRRHGRPLGDRSGLVGRLRALAPPD